MHNILSMNKQRILFVLHLPPPVHGAAMMGKYIHDSRVINEAFECKYINLTSAKTLQDIGKGGVIKYIKYLMLLCKVILKVITFRPQLVYVTPTACGVAFYKDFLVVQLLKLMGRKVVVHYHNKGVVTRQDKKLDDWMYRRFFKGIKVILLSDALYEDVKKYVKREQVLICENGIPDTSEKSEKIIRNNPIPRILFLSNLLITKGVIVLLDALKLLKDKNIGFVCNFVGAETNEIDASHFLKEVQKRGLQQEVKYLGKKYGKEKEELYRTSDIFVFPTYYYNECFPLVLLEAMQMHLPCISTTEGGISSIINDGENGYLVEMNNPIALADSIEKLLKDADLRKNMGENGWKRFKSDFTLEAFEKRMEFCLKKALK